MLSKLLGVDEPIYIVETGPSDAFGYAGCRLSDGMVGTVKNPVIGKFAYANRHNAVITHYQNKDAVKIEVYGEEPFDLTAQERMGKSLEELLAYIMKEKLNA